MRLFLICPHPLLRGRGIKKNFRVAPNYSILHIARITPPDVEIEVVNEAHEEIDWEKEYDLVGITCMTYQARRAYEVGDAFRRRGVKVVMGGFHTTFCSEECLGHADAVVAGEAEGVWEEVIRDCQKGTLRPFYHSETPWDLKNLPPPRYDLIKNSKGFLFGRYLFTPTFATRGCLHNCDFCSVRRFYPVNFRTRPIDEVVRDIEISGVKKTIFLVDDDFACDRKYARELLRELIPLNIEWVGQGDISIGADVKFLDLARKSGLNTLYIGLETICVKNFPEMNKTFLHVDKYPLYLKNLRSAGINCVASMMYGFDHDDPAVFDKTIDFLVRHRVPGYMGYVYTPYPGSEFSFRLRQENR